VDFTISDEIMLMKKAIRDFVENEVDPRAIEIEEKNEIPPDLLEKAKEIGLFGLSIPAEYGGAGIGMLGKCLVFEELGRTHNGFVGVIGAHNGIGSVGIVDLGTPEQKQKYLPSMATGETIGAFALTETSAGSDAANLKTIAVRNGDQYILNGTKHFISNLLIGKIFTVMAVTDKAKELRGITSFIAERDYPGFQIGKIEKKMGLHGLHTGELIFEDCVVPAENVLGKEGGGYINALKILTNGRAGLAARNVGSSQKLLELSIEYAKQRIQFNKPIIEFQAIQHMLAEMAMEIEAARGMVYRVAWMVDEGRRVIKEAAMTKLFASEVLARVVDKALQIHGGMGYMQEAHIERFYRDARVARIYEGTSEIQKNIIAAQLIQDYS
jgi:acyl-CoA dehydrogenase